MDIGFKILSEFWWFWFAVLGKLKLNFYLGWARDKWVGGPNIWSAAGDMLWNPKMICESITSFSMSEQVCFPPMENPLQSVWAQFFFIQSLKLTYIDSLNPSGKVSNFQTLKMRALQSSAANLKNTSKIQKSKFKGAVSVADSIWGPPKINGGT